MKNIFISAWIGFGITLNAWSLTSSTPSPIPTKPVATPSPSASPTNPSSVSTTASSTASSTASTTTQTWDSWYTVSIGGKIPYGYYHDKVDVKEGKIAFQNQYWKREEGYINEEQLIAFSENTKTLTPILFNFKSNYRGTEVVLDGTFKNGVLSVKVRQNKKDEPKIERSQPKGAIFSSQFPIWIGKNLSSFKIGKKESFKAILEDNVQKRYQPVSGNLTLEADDETATSTHTKKLSIDYNNQKSIWYVHPTGETEKIVIKGAPGAEIIVNKVSESVARRYLME